MSMIAGFQGTIAELKETAASLNAANIQLLNMLTLLSQRVDTLEQKNVPRPAQVVAPATAPTAAKSATIKP